MRILTSGTRAYAASVIVLIALSVAAGTVMFTVYKGALLDPWPYDGGDRLLVFRGDYPAVDRVQYPLWSARDYDEVRVLGDVFDHVIAGRGRDANLAAAGGAELVRGAELTPNAFAMLGVPPLYGRALAATDAGTGAPPVVVIGHGLWQRRYGGDAAAIGQTLPIDGVQHAIVGIMPPRFLWWGSELWLPLTLDAAEPRRDDRRYVIQARLRAGVGLQQANTALAHWARGVERAHRDEYPEYRNWTASVGLLVDAVVRDLRDVLGVLFAAVVALVLVAGFNVANLLLARAAARRREFAVRTALGASTLGIARALAGENLLLAAIGAALGLVTAYVLADVVVALIPFGYMPAEANLDVDARAGAIATALAAVIAMLAALPAVAYLRRQRVAEALREARASGSRSAVRLRSAFVVVQLAMAAVVVSGALAVGTSFRERLAADPGFVRENAVKLRIALPRDGYPDRPALRRFALDLERRLGDAPGVDAAGIGIAAPLDGGSLHPVIVRDRAGASVIESRYEIVAGDWFGALGVPLRAGRAFDERDQPASLPVAVVNATFVRAILGDADPIGAQIQAGPGGAERAWLTIVGVAGDVRVGGIDGEVRPLVYQPLAQSDAQLRNAIVLARGGVPTTALTAAVRHAVAALDATVAVHDVATFDDIVRDSLGGQRLAAWLFAGFALAVIMLAALGVHGIVSYVAQLSTIEYGLRMALGATALDIAGIIGRRSLVLAGAGVASGALLAVAGLRVMAATLAHPLPATAPTVLAAAALLAGVVVAACAGPALRAARIHPAVAFRTE